MRWKMRKLKVTDEEFEPVLHIYAAGYGINQTEIIIKLSNFDEAEYHCYTIESAKEMVKYLNMAIEDAEKRKLMPIEDEEDDEER
jgi:hypothetical protein